MVSSEQFFSTPSSSSCFSPAPAWALHKPQFLQGISACSSLWSSTGCSVNTFSTVFLFMGCRDIPVPQESHHRLQRNICFSLVFCISCRGISTLAPRATSSSSFFSDLDVHRVLSLTVFPQFLFL